MDYSAWRISFQSSEQAARSAYEQLAARDAEIAELRKDAESMVIDVDWLSNVIRSADGDHSLGAGALAEKIVEAIEREKQ